MRIKILANIKTDLMFFFRNGLLLLIFTILVTQTIMSVFLRNLLGAYRGSGFEAIKNFTETFNNFGYILVVAVGIVTVFSHSSQRCLKMVFTRPCPPEIWMASLAISITIVATVLFFLSFFVGSLLFVVEEIPYQSGLVFVCIQKWCEALIVSFFLLLLSLVIHPVLAIFLICVMNERSLYWLHLLIKAALQNASSFTRAFLLDLAKSLTGLLYRIFPVQVPYEEQFSEIARSWIVLPRDWFHLMIFVAYTFAFCCLIILLASEVLKRKRLT